MFALFTALTALISLTAITRSDASESSTKSTHLSHSRVIALPKEWFHRFQTGNVDRTQLDERVNEQLTESAIRHEAATLQRYGQPASFEFVNSNQVEYAIGYNFVLTFKSGKAIKAKIIEAIAFDPDGKIAGIDFAVFPRLSTK